MRSTISEKIIARASGKKEVVPGEFVYVEPDLGPISYAFGRNDPTRRVARDLEFLGVKRVKNPERCVVVFDHSQPAVSREDAELHKSVKSGVKELGVKHFYDMEGIGHVLLAEKGVARPGMLLVHGDPHASTLGAIGLFVTNGGRFGGTPTEVYVTGRLLLRVPETLRINVTGRLGKGVMSRDIWQHIIGDIGPDGALAKVMEYTGPALKEMSIDGRMTMCNPVVFTGAETGVVNPDKRTFNWVRERTDEAFEAVRSDPDALYGDVLEYEASKIEPLVAVPPNVFLTKTVTEVEGEEIDQAVLGTCAGGRVEDLRVAAKILKGRRVHPDVRMLVVPATWDVYLNSVKEGLIETIVRAGGKVCAPTCDICWGRLGCLADGETCISQQTLNIPGRSGSSEADIYLASAATITASAVEGRISDPRNLL